MNVFITSGGTRVPIDDVRHIANMSTGRYGAQLAAALYDAGHNVTIYRAKGSISPHDFVKTDADVRDNHSVTEYFFDDYFDYKENAVSLAVRSAPDVIVSAAAVSDYIVDKTPGKISSADDEIVIRLKKAAKILPAFKAKLPDSILVGFKLLVNPQYSETYGAVQKVLNSGADYVVYNDLAQIKRGNDTRLIFAKDMTFRVLPSINDLIHNLVEAVLQ